MEPNKKYLISFLTICFNNFNKLKQTYYENVQKYKDNDAVEFLLVDFGGDDTTEIKEYIVTNFFYELKIDKLKYYKINFAENNLDIDFDTYKIISKQFSTNSLFTYNLNIMTILNGQEYSLLNENIKKKKKIKDKNIIKNNDYDQSIDNNLQYEKFNYNDYKLLTCFSVLFKTDDFIDNLINDILSQTIFNNIHFILINMYETNSKKTNKKIKKLKKFDNIQIIYEKTDYGLYNMWNNCVKLSKTYFVSNMNPDDIRGCDWAYQQIINFEPNVILVTPKYIPTKKLLLHSELILDNSLPVWFDKKTVIFNKKPYFSKINSYFSSKDMFQYNGDNDFQSNNISNCSPIWRKDILHNNNNFFDEEKYGGYADFAVWLEAGSKNYLFKQTDYKVGFYISDDQLHKRQKKEDTILKSLILKYADNNYISLLE
jgi:hypothetical protein